MGGPIPGLLYGYEYNDTGSGYFFRGSKYNPESRELKKILINSENNQVFHKWKLSKPPKKNYATKNLDVCHIEDIWSLDLLDLNNYGPENIRNYSYVFVVVDNFSIFVWTISLKNKNSQPIEKSFKFNNIGSKRSSMLSKRDRGKEIFNNTVQNFFSNNTIKHQSRKSSLGAVFAERLNCTNKDLPKRLVFEKRDGHWIDILPTITKL